MKESLFKKNGNKIRTEAHFVKNDGPVSSLPESYDEEKLLALITSELGALFSKMRADGFSRSELEITVSSRVEGIAVSIKCKNRLLSINEINLICRLAIDHGLSPRIIDDGVEVISRIPMLESSNLYAKAALLLREEIDSSFYEETN